MCTSLPQNAFANSGYANSMAPLVSPRDDSPLHTADISAAYDNVLDSVLTTSAPPANNSKQQTSRVHGAIIRRHVPHMKGGSDNCQTSSFGAISSSPIRLQTVPNMYVGAEGTYVQREHVSQAGGSPGAIRALAQSAMPVQEICPGEFSTARRHGHAHTVRGPTTAIATRG